MNKIVALAAMASLDCGEIGCTEKSRTPLERQAVDLGIDLDEVRDIRDKLFGKLGAVAEGFCSGHGENPCTIVNSYSVQCWVDKDESTAYFRARNAAMLDRENHAGLEFNGFLNNSVDAKTQDGFSINCVKSTVDTGF